MGNRLIEIGVGDWKLKREGNGWNEGVVFLNVKNFFKKTVRSGRARFINDATSP